MKNGENLDPRGENSKIRDVSESLDTRRANIGFDDAIRFGHVGDAVERSESLREKLLSQILPAPIEKLAAGDQVDSRLRENLNPRVHCGLPRSSARSCSNEIPRPGSASARA